MKAPLIDNPAEIINSHRGILDIYVFHRHGVAESLIVRAWPKKPEDRSGNFPRTHEAARVCLDSYRKICDRFLSASRPLFDFVRETPLDYWRSGNQSISYKLSDPAFVSCVDFIGYDPMNDGYELHILAPGTHYLNRATLPTDNGKPKTYRDYRLKRTGMLTCNKLFRNYTEGVIHCKEIESNLFVDFVPYNFQINYFVPQYLSYNCLPALSLPLIITN